jgi:transposase
MNVLRELVHRLRMGESDRAIASDMHIGRNTVSKYRHLSEKHGYLNPDTELPEVKVLAAVLGPAPQPPRTVSTVLPYQQVVEELLELDVEMMTIFDRLRQNYGYTGSYSSIRRFVRHLRPPGVEAFVRVHAAPGEEAQVDFGSAGMLLDPVSQRLRQAYIFVMTLCFSRHQYAELVFDQKIATWIGLHRRAFESFGGVPHREVLDNLKAAVLEASLHDPVLGEAYRRFAQHYGLIVSPNRPGTPQHKGKVENGVHFVKRSFMAGQTFTDIREANRKLALWVQERAGTRQHGTTHQSPLGLFLAQEKDKLLPLPGDPFELTETRVVKLHPDCHVTIDGSYYSAPYRYVGQLLDAYIFERVVQLFRGTELLITHPRATHKGQWFTKKEHYPPGKAAYLEKTPLYCREQAASIGPAVSEVVDMLLNERPLDKLRSVQAILRLTDSVGQNRLEAACHRALFYSDVRYRRIKDILNAALDQLPLPEASPAPSPATVFTFQRPASDFFGQPEAAG